ncbi:MAG: sigma 54-interacting transcriptional regulator [Deltaproteobacteria bacterium]|nr:sigma 54-interacting transcriptional regulator [Deltaproteobacteria bacterium]
MIGRFDDTLKKRKLPPLVPRRRVARVVYSTDTSAVGRFIDLGGAGAHTPEPSTTARIGPLSERTVVLGRGVRGEGAIEDEHMSREHLELVKGDPHHRVQVIDLGTRNGTFVDGERIAAPVSLTSGSVVSAGDTLLVIDEELDPDLLPASGDADGASAHEVVGISFAAARLRASLETVARARGSVLLLGATGTGKEVAARAIHRLSNSGAAAWVPVNCAAIPSEIAEAELFGHRRGAFTGATADREGLFARAAGGTLFLDEVGDLPLPLQAKLLRALEDGTIQPLGGQLQTVDTRVLAATHLDLDESTFRKDLYARLGDWVLHIPPLTDRRADILTLWEHFLRIEAAPGHPGFVSTPELSEALLLHSWPMNIRELRKLARRVASLARPGEPLDLPVLSEQLQTPVRLRAPKRTEGRARPPPDPLPECRELAGPEGRTPEVDESRVNVQTPEPRAESFDEEDGSIPSHQELTEALRNARGNVKKVAELLGAHRTQVYRWFRRRGIDPERFR